MADFNKPSLGDAYEDFLDFLNEKIVDVAQMFSSAPTNPQENFLKLLRSSSEYKIQEYISSAWTDRILSVAGGGTGRAIADGWIPFGVTLTRTGTNTCTASGDWSSIVTIGDKIWLTQTTSKYFVVTGVSYSSGTTTFTFFAGDVYTLAAAAITDPYFSKVANPAGFPTSFTWVITHTGFSADPSYSARFHTIGRRCFLSYLPTSGTSNSTDYQFSLPIVAATMAGAQWQLIPGFCYDNGVRGVDPFPFIGSGSSTVTIQLTGGHTSFQSSGTKSCQVSGDYPF